jgi:hypothetical protein
MELYKKYDTLSSVESGERMSNELKILRSLVGESFTNTEKCITEIFDKLASFNEKVLLGTFDINERDTLKNEMYAISDRHFNDNTIINLIMDYVDKNYANINKFNLSGFYLLKSNKGISNFYMKMLTIIFYPKIILNMISDKMIDSIIAIKEKRDDLLADGDDNINSIIERLFGKSSYGFNYDWVSGTSDSARSDGTMTLGLDSSRSSRSDGSADSDGSVRPPGLRTTGVGGAPSPADPAVAAGADGADGADGDSADGDSADGDDGDSADGDGATPPAAAPVGADGAGDLSSRPANPLISFLNSDNSYMKQSGLIFYNALTNFAVSIGIYKGNYQEQIANKLRELIKTTFKVIDPDNQAGTDYTNLKDTAQQTFNAAKSALENLSEGREYIQNEERIEVLKNEYNEEENKLKTDSNLISDSNFMKEYRAIQESLNKAIYDLGVIRHKIETLPLVQFRDSVVDYLNAKLALDIASKKPDIQREISKALFLVLKLGGENTYHIFMNDMYKDLTPPNSVNGNYTLALDKYITSGIGKSIMFQFNVPKPVDEAKPKSSSIISGLFSRKAKGGKRGTRRYKKRAGTRRQKKRRGTHRKRKNTTK